MVIFFSLYLRCLNVVSAIVHQWQCFLAGPSAFNTAQVVSKYFIFTSCFPVWLVPINISIIPTTKRRHQLNVQLIEIAYHCVHVDLG
ncbi:hypothetical protein M758_UG271600 [Ceratodon purpureus]|nr:hypothetical protein M758_UG271600 [Ceratodon purpureus]